MQATSYERNIQDCDIVSLGASDHGVQAAIDQAIQN